MKKDFSESAKQAGIDFSIVPTPPVANYIPYVISGKQVFISGQIAIEDGKIKYTGKVGDDISVEDGVKAAKLCAKNIIIQLYSACSGNLNKVKKCVKLGVFVNCNGNFYDQPLVANGASDLIVEIFGDAGKHARAAVGSYSLPRNTAVEVDAIFEIE